MQFLGPRRRRDVEIARRGDEEKQAAARAHKYSVPPTAPLRGEAHKRYPSKRKSLNWDEPVPPSGHWPIDFLPSLQAGGPQFRNRPIDLFQLPANSGPCVRDGCSLGREFFPPAGARPRRPCFVSIDLRKKSPVSIKRRIHCSLPDS